MEKEVKTIGVEVTKVVETMKQEGTKPVQKPVSKSEKPKKVKADELQQEVDRKTEELKKCLAELERKKQLSNNRTAFLHALDKLEDADNKLNVETGFETALYKLRFSDASGYSNSDIFSISNSFILSEFIGFMRGKIQLRISEIEQLLITE